MGLSVIHDLPISRPGQKDPAVNASYHVGKLGRRYNLIDLDWNEVNAGRVGNELSSSPVTVLFVRNAGSALTPGTVAKWSLAGREVNGNAGVGEAGAGIVDPFLTSNVATNEKFLLFIHGPVPVRVNAALSANAAIKNVANGLVDANGRATVAEVFSSVGVMLESAGALNQLRRAFVDFETR